MGIAVITLADIQQWIPMITALLVVAFDWGILYAKIKTFVTKEQVGAIVDEKLKGHCPNALPIRNIDLKVQALENWKQVHIETGSKVREANHLALQELRINLKSLCQSMGVKYQNGKDE
jgi:hypothetical protein